jgi:hypothetical protein
MVLRSANIIRGMKHSTLPRKPVTEGFVVRADDEPGNDAAYTEYVRGFDDVPVLLDAVRIPPRRAFVPDFRRGERRDARKESRPDGYTVRESKSAEIELLYHEYARADLPAAAGAAPAITKRPKASKKPKRPKRPSAKRKRR